MDLHKDVSVNGTVAYRFNIFERDSSAQSQRRFIVSKIITPPSNVHQPDRYTLQARIAESDRKELFITHDSATN